MCFTNESARRLRAVRTASKRNYALDFLKGIATIAIVFHHYQQATGAKFAYNFCDGWFYYGYVVELFFLVSGYVMGRYVKPIYEGEISLKCWMAKRMLRYIPIMAIGALIFDRTLLEDYIQYTVTFLVFPAILVLLETPAIQKLFAWRIWGTFGKISFDVYIWSGTTSCCFR